MQLTLSHASFGLLLLLSVSVQAKGLIISNRVVDSVTQQAELNENKVTFLQDVVITQGSIIIHADKVVVLRHERAMTR